MKIKLIASDLDGTLLSEKETVLRETRDAITRAVQQGAHFVPATGRAFRSVPREVLELPGVEYVITSNGAAVVSLKENRRIYECLLESESVEKILEIPVPKHVAYEAFIEGKPYASIEYVERPELYGAKERSAAYVKRTRTPVKDMKEFIYEHRNELDSIDFVCDEEVVRTEIRAQLRDQVPNIFVTSSVAQLIEIAHKKAGKGQTLRWLLKNLDISHEEALCFGDADNDIDMLNAVRYGVAMENASPDCKKAAWAITESNRVNGVGKMIERCFNPDGFLC